jgi:hypothetical protein
LSIDTSKLIETLLQKYSKPETNSDLLRLTVQILRQVTDFLHSRQILMSLEAHKYFLNLIVSNSIETDIKLIVFDCVLNILKDFENIEIFLLEDALVIFTNMLNEKSITTDEIIKCLKGELEVMNLIIQSYLLFKFKRNIHIDQY